MSDSQKPPLTLEDVREDVRILENSAFDKLELEVGGFRLMLPRGRNAAAGRRRVPLTGRRSSRLKAEPHSRERAASTEVKRRRPWLAGLIEIRAPTVGTFYRCTGRPGAPPFVDLGAMVEPQTTIGIIEIMKLMNAVPAGVAGEVRESLRGVTATRSNTIRC